MISVERSPNSTVTAQGSGRKSRPPDAGEADSVDAHGPPAHAVPGVRCRGRNRKFRRAEAAACWLEELDRRELLTTFLVTNTADAGTGSLRAAILNADSTSGPSEIQFAIGSGLQTIQPLSALPPITEPVTIDGTTQPGFAGTPIIDIDGSLSGTTIAGLELQSSGSTIRGLVINHFSDRALYLDSGASNNLIVGDYLGTDFTGNVAEPNGLWGVDMIDAGSGNTVGGVAPADRNIIASNQYGGIALNGASVTNTAIIGNDIGVGADGSTPLGNAYAGVLTMNGASDNQIGGAVPGQGNVIANNGEGVIIWGGVGNAILGNQIYGNSSLGIDLNWDGVTPNHVGSVSGPNNDQNSPVLTQAVTDGAHLQVSGSLNSTPNTTFRIEFFANPVADPSGHGQGQTYLGFANVTTDSSGNATIAVQLQAIVAPGQAISATATDAGGNTSEFAQDVAATAGSTIVVDTTSDVDDGNTASITALLRNRGPDGLISLREAILAVDNTPGFDTIDFDIPGAGIQTIIPSGALPHVTNPVVLDATSQPGYAGTPLIELDGTLLPFSADGIEVNAPSTTVEGFSIYGFSGNGIKVDAVGLTAIKGNLIGLRGDGALAPSNGTGIVLSGATGTTIGGSSTSNANVIAGNTSGGIRIEGGASGNAVLGNLIGTDPSGTTAIANGYGIEINGSANNTIGGTTPVAGNVISGNTSDGIDVEAAGSSGNLIEGNLLGTNAGRGLPLANGGNGITISLGATNDTIGGTAAGAGNVIANSALDGVAVTGGNGIAILADSFQANAGMGIDLEQNPGASTDGALTPGQPNQGMNVPVFSSAVWNGSSLTVSGYVGQPNTGGAGFANDRIEVYLLDGTAGGSQSQGRTLIGVLTSSSQGAFSGTLTGEGISASSAVTGTATAPSDGTSEFATAVAATSPGGLIATTTTLQASTAISTYGQKVTFTATVNGPLGLVQFATGSVTFYDGSVVLGTSTVSGGTATLSTTTLAAGTVEMSATYNGDVLDEASDSAALPQMINPAPLTITANAAAKAYGQNLPSFTASYAGLVNGDTPANLSSTFRLEFSTAANASSPAGNYSLSPYGFNDPNYAPTYVASTLTVTPAPLTVEAVSQSKVYGQPAPLLTVRFCGLVNGDTPADLTGLVLTSPATQSSPVGTYRITPSGIVSTNYFITYVDSTLTITPAPLTVQTDNSARVYGQPNPAFTGTISGLTNSDTTTALGTLTFSTDATQSSPVGSYNVTPGGLSDPNYTISYAPGALMVTPAPVTVTADNASKVYGQPNPDFTATYSGLVNGDTPLEIGTLALSTTETQASPVGAYAITPAGLDDPNYAITYTPGTLTVTPAPLTISAENASKVYGQPNPDFTATYSGLVNRDSPADLGTLLVDTAADAASSVGSYSVTPYGLDETNYDVTYLPATLVVAPAPLTVTADNASRLYGQANPAFTATFTGLVSGDIPASLGTLTFRCAATPASLVGSYPITPLGIDDPNYAVTYLDATLSVSPALLTVTAKSATRAYGLPNSAFSGDFAGLVNDDTPSSLGTLSYFTVADGSSPAGTYAVMPSGLNDTNYAISYQAGTLTVTPAPLTVTVDSASKLYGQPLPTFSATDSGLVNGDTPASVGTLLFSTTASAESPTGDFAIAASGLSDPNYNVTYIAGTLRVVAAPLTVMVDDVTKLYGQPNPGFTATFTGLSNSDTPALLGTLSFETPAQASSAVGTYPVIASGLNDPDYAINYQPGNLSVDPALLTVTTDDSTKVYGAATPPFTASFAGLAAGDVPADLGTVSFFTPADDSSTPGEYPVTPFGLGDPNYAIVYRAGRLTVTPRVLNVTSLTVPATEGTPFAGLVATFSDESPAPVDRYSAEIHWGDGHVSPGTITYDPSRQIFNVVGTNTFGTAGSFATDVQIDFDAAEASTTGTAIVTGAPLVVSVRNLPVTTGVPFQGIVATFSDAGTPRDPSEYSATISWGDGQVSAGTIRRDDGTLTVSGGNTFGAEGVYAARVVVLANGGGEGTASGLAVVTDAALTIEGIPVSASTGEPFHGIVARFDVADDSDSDSDFSAAVDWGDGITTPAKVSQTGPRSFVVVGTHAYTAEGSLHAAVTVTGPDQVRSIADVPTTISSFVTLTPVVSDSDLGTVPPVLTLGPIGGSTPPSRVLSFSPTAPMPFAVALILGNGALGESPTTPASGVTATASTAFSPSNPALAGHSRDGNPGISDAPPVAAVQAAFSNVVESTSPRLAVVAAAISGNGTNVDVRTALPAPSQPPALAGLIAPPDRLWEALDNIEKQVAAGHPFDKLEEVIGVGAVAYVGYVLLHARGGYVLLSLLTSRPLWSEMDPLAVLSDWEKERKRPGGTPAGEEEETLQSLIEGNRDREDADADHGAHQPGSFQPYHQHLIRRPRPRATARPRGRRAEGTKGPV